MLVFLQNKLSINIELSYKKNSFVVTNILMLLEKILLTVSINFILLPAQYFIFRCKNRKETPCIFKFEIVFYFRYTRVNSLVFYFRYTRVNSLVFYFRYTRVNSLVFYFRYTRVNSLVFYFRYTRVNLLVFYFRYTRINSLVFNFRFTRVNSLVFYFRYTRVNSNLRMAGLHPGNLSPISYPVCQWWVVNLSSCCDVYTLLAMYLSQSSTVANKTYSNAIKQV